MYILNPVPYFLLDLDIDTSKGYQINSNCERGCDCL